MVVQSIMKRKQDCKFIPIASQSTVLFSYYGTEKKSKSGENFNR